MSSSIPRICALTLSVLQEQVDNTSIKPILPCASPTFRLVRWLNAKTIARNTATKTKP